MLVDLHEGKKVGYPGVISCLLTVLSGVFFLLWCVPIFCRLQHCRYSKILSIEIEKYPPIPGSVLSWAWVMLVSSNKTGLSKKIKPRAKQSDISTFFPDTHSLSLVVMNLQYEPQKILCRLCSRCLLWDTCGQGHLWT